MALTRARCKCVLFLPRPLLEASPQVLDVPAAALGWAFMRRLVAEAESHGQELHFEGDVVVARVLRLSRPLAPTAAAKAAPSPNADCGLRSIVT